MVEGWATGRQSMKASKNPDTGQWEAIPTPLRELNDEQTHVNYQVAMRRLMKSYGMKLSEAQDMLNTYYTMPDNMSTLVGKSPKQVKEILKGRPLLDFQDRQALITGKTKSGKRYPRGLVGNAGLYDISAYMRLLELMRRRGDHTE
jgi:hypothetical protein